MDLKSTHKQAISLCCLIWVVSLLAACFPYAKTPPTNATASATQADQTTSLTARQQLKRIKYTLQIGAFSSGTQAAQLATALIAKGIDAYYFIDGDGLYKVRFERFNTRAAARERAILLQQQRLINDFYIARPRPGVAYQALLRAALVHTVRRFIGSPYQWGRASAQAGFDCSGLTQTVYRLNGLELPRKAATQFQAGKPVARTALQRGDLVFFATGFSRRVTHVGVYIGKNQFIHAPGRGKSIRVTSLHNSYFKKRYLGARTYL